jgi:hypothetical protein
MEVAGEPRRQPGREAPQDKAGALKPERLEAHLRSGVVRIWLFSVRLSIGLVDASCESPVQVHRQMLIQHDRNIPRADLHFPASPGGQ